MLEVQQFDEPRHRGVSLGEGPAVPGRSCSRVMRYRSPLASPRPFRPWAALATMSWSRRSFTCDYGYNVSIGQNVVIGRNCTIQDTCEVKIGDNSLIGPNVGIYTTSVSLDPKRRMGSTGPQIGKPITIEADCFIGAGAMILPGRTIGKGSTVGAGAIVTKVSVYRCAGWTGLHVGYDANEWIGCAAVYDCRRDTSEGVRGALRQECETALNLCPSVLLGATSWVFFFLFFSFLFSILDVLFSA